jgi:hypothetical protein
MRAAHWLWLRRYAALSFVGAFGLLGGRPCACSTRSSSSSGWQSLAHVSQRAGTEMSVGMISVIRARQANQGAFHDRAVATGAPRHRSGRQRL